MADEHISPGFLTPSAAAYLKRVALETERNRQQAAEMMRHADVKDFPALITSGSGAHHAWTEQAFDENGERYTRPGGRTGTASVNPAVTPSRRPMDYPCEVWLRRTLWNATYGIIYETVGGKGDPESSAITITSSTPVASRYPAVRRVQVGLPATWTTHETVWVYNTQSTSLYAGLTLANAKYNTDTYLGLDQLAVDYCCTNPAADACGCEIPALMCLEFDSTDPVIDGQQYVVRDGLSDPLWGCDGPSDQRLSVACVNGAWSPILVTNIGSVPSGTVVTCNSTCFISGTGLSVEVDCGPPFVATFTGEFYGTGVCDGTAFTATMTTISDETECVGSGASGGGGTGNCITSDCGPPSIPSSITLTWAITTTDGACAGTDAEEETLNWSHYGGSSNYWILTGTFGGEEFYLVFQCGPDANPSTYLSLQFTSGGSPFYGTLTETVPGTWTFLIEDITLPTDDGCVYSIGGSFDEADC
jgi:hypothetical protein